MATPAAPVRGLPIRETRRILKRQTKRIISETSLGTNSVFTGDRSVSAEIIPAGVAEYA
jgi:hypothetical protein